MSQKYHYLIILGAIFLLVYLSFDLFFVHFIPFILGIILASLLEPAVCFLQERLRFNRGAAALVTLLLFLAVVLTLSFFFLFRIYLELNIIIYELPDYRTIVATFDQIASQNRELYSSLQELDLPPILLETLDDYVQRSVRGLRVTFVNLMNFIIEAFKRIPRLLLQLVITCIAAFFFCRDGEIINKSLHSILPAEWYEKADAAYRELSHASINFIRAEIVLISLTTLIAVFGFYLNGMDYALILGITVGLLDIIPIMGPGLVFIPWIAFSLLSGNPLFALYLGVLFGLIILARQKVEAKLDFKAELHPLLLLLSLYIGVHLLGGIGLLIGPLFVLVIKTLLRSQLIPVFKKV